MQTLVLSDTKQVFNGVTYYKCGSYFQKQGKRLHRAIWEFFNGPILPGCDVHHINHDKSDNRIENLTMMQEHDHLSYHGKKLTHLDRAIKAAQDAARAWHGSADGKAFHSTLAKEIWLNQKFKTYTCTFCGKSFETKHCYAESGNKFCHQNCRAAYRRKKIKQNAS